MNVSIPEENKSLIESEYEASDSEIEHIAL